MTIHLKTIEWTTKTVKYFGPVANYAETPEIQQVAEWMELDPHEVAWALETYGRCDGIGKTAWAAYEPSEEAPHDEDAKGEPDEYQPAERQKGVITPMPSWEFWCVITHEQWEEAVIVGGRTAQEAEDKAEAVIMENSQDQDHEYRDRNFVIQNASYHK